MASISTRFLTTPRGRRRLWISLLVVPLVLAGLSWTLTEPLADRGAKRLAVVSRPPLVSTPAPAASRPEGLPTWPEDRLEGDRAKALLLKTLLTVSDRLHRVPGYTARLYKQERIDSKLGPRQTIELKLRESPFAVYLKYLSPGAGKEVIYAEGHHENKLIAHAGGLARRLLPRLALHPTHPIALAENRHPITETGLAKLTDKLIGFRRLDLLDPDAVTILDRASGPEDRSCLRSLHLHTERSPARPFARVEVLYDPETRFPVQISSFDWPAPGHQGELLLAERYTYENLNSPIQFSDLDFDPANPAYDFHRF